MSVSTSFDFITRFINPVWHRLGRATLLVTFIWAFTLWWGERGVFQKSAAACEWHTWEAWPAEANPHHVLFVADPQLVDPHTYPDRPWPLSSLTVLYTDIYLRRAYRYILNHVQPHTTLFLGDLFDGGREWAAADYHSPEDRYRKYDTNFWLKEYDRFMNLFIGEWYNHRWDGYLTGEGRKIIASLPGNHDLGFAGGINEHVRDRFEAHFGPSNRIDILGNHTFVSLDTVSLSAMDQVDPVTGSSGHGDGTGHDTKYMEIWKPVEQFLMDVKGRRAKAVQRRYQYWRSMSDPNAKIAAAPLQSPKVKSIGKGSGIQISGHQQDAQVASSNFPTILLSHVPLYRNSDVTCGPNREKGNAIPLAAGYQYQNVLTPDISEDIVNHLDANEITMIYSGDDHDYCEVDHGEFTGQIKEITVKSMSWAMGVRIPGVQLASLWNPIDVEGIAKGEATNVTPRDTVQNHLCLLPDQLGIFIRYGQVLGLSILILLVRAIAYNPQQAYQQLSSSPVSAENSQPLLPISRKRTPPSSPKLTATPGTQQGLNNTSAPLHTHSARARSNGKISGYGNLPVSSRSTSPATSELIGNTDDWGMPTGRSSGPHTQSLARPSQHPAYHAQSTAGKLVYSLITPASSKFGEFLRSLTLVAGSVLLFYSWLLWNG